MDPIFTLDEYVIKRKGLGIGGKHELYGSDPRTPLLYIEEKSTLIPLATAVHLYRDASKAQELLTLRDSKADGADLDVVDTATDAVLGSIGMAADNLKEFVKDYWAIYGTDGKPLARFGEKSVTTALLREFVAHDIKQSISVLVGDQVVAEFKQKTKMVGYELLLDFSMDVNHLLDRRLGIAAAVYAANHQSQEVDW